jgi:hypothetical protein
VRWRCRRALRGPEAGTALGGLPTSPAGHAGEDAKLRRLWDQYRVAIAEAKAELSIVSAMPSTAPTTTLRGRGAEFAGAIAGLRYLAMSKDGWIDEPARDRKRTDQAHGRRLTPRDQGAGRSPRVRRGV